MLVECLECLENPNSPKKLCSSHYYMNRPTRGIAIHDGIDLYSYDQTTSIDEQQIILLV